MLIAQQEIQVTPGTINANHVSNVQVTFAAGFKPNLPIIPVLDFQDAGLTTGLVLEGAYFYYNSGTPVIVLTISNPTTGNLTDNTAHNIWFTQVE